MDGLIQATRTLVVLGWREGPGRLTLAASLMLGSFLAPLAIGLLLAKLTTAALQGDQTVAIAAAAGTAACLVAQLTFATFANVAYLEVADSVLLAIDADLIVKMNGSTTIEQQENPEYADKLSLLRDDLYELTSAFQSILESWGLAVSIVAAAVILALLSPLLLLLPLFAVPPLLVARWTQRRTDDVRAEVTESIRIARALVRLATSAASSAEVRLYRLGDELEARQIELWRSINARRWRVERLNTLVMSIAQLAFPIGYLGSIAYVASRAAHGSASVGDVVLTIAVAAQVNQQVSLSVGIFRNLGRTAAMIGRYKWLGEFAQARAGRAVGSPPAKLREGIRFEHVSFSYPGSARSVLDDVDVTLPAGSVVAIVGENGAGKTTLVKLLARFYEPTSGRILVDGVPLDTLDVGRWRARMTAAFQDFVRFEVRARETVGLGDVPQIESVEAVGAALDRAGARSVVEALGDGLETQLGRSYLDGAELSGGQWQKMALARGSMRTSPLVVVLDEPTAALDAQAEQELFDHYAAEARRASAEVGSITLLASHRFGSVRAADLILVLEDGVIKEAGSHDELCRRDGLYAELYRLQAQAYR